MRYKLTALMIIVFVSLLGCQSMDVTNPPTATATPKPTQMATLTPSSTATPTPTSTQTAFVFEGIPQSNLNESPEVPSQTPEPTKVIENPAVPGVRIYGVSYSWFSDYRKGPTHFKEIIMYLQDSLEARGCSLVTFSNVDFSDGESCQAIIIIEGIHDDSFDTSEDPHLIGHLESIQLQGYGPFTTAWSPGYRWVPWANLRSLERDGWFTAINGFKGGFWNGNAPEYLILKKPSLEFMDPNIGIPNAVSLFLNRDMVSEPLILVLPYGKGASKSNVQQAIFSTEVEVVVASEEVTCSSISLYEKEGLILLQYDSYLSGELATSQGGTPGAREVFYELFEASLDSVPINDTCP